MSKRSAAERLIVIRHGSAILGLCFFASGLFSASAAIHGHHNGVPFFRLVTSIQGSIPSLTNSRGSASSRRLEQFYPVAGGPHQRNAPMGVAAAWFSPMCLSTPSGAV